MKIYEYQERFHRIRNLAKRNATGTPKELANKIGVSERTLFRIVNQMKHQGVAIEYSRKINTYFINS